MSATYSSFTVIGQREDLSDVMENLTAYDISPQDTTRKVMICREICRSRGSAR
jgi:hypothetical protein